MWLWSSRCIFDFNVMLVAVKAVCMAGYLAIVTPRSVNQHPCTLSKYKTCSSNRYENTPILCSELEALIHATELS